MEATVDVWEIPPERASRVDHPAPFPVALPERLIHMNSYVGDLVLDPFMGSGTTAVAAVRTGRHYIGYDTDAGYVEAAQQRIAGEVLARRQSNWRPATVARPTRFAADGPRRSSPSGSSLRRASRTSTMRPTSCPLWHRHCVPSRRQARSGGSRSSAVEHRIEPGAQRIELLWRAISKGAIVREVDPSAGFAVLTVDQPASASGGRALAAVTGRGKPVMAVIDMLSEDAVSDGCRRWERCRPRPVRHGSGGVCGAF